MDIETLRSQLGQLGYFAFDFLQEPLEPINQEAFICGLVGL